MPDLFAFVPTFTSHEVPPGTRFGEPVPVRGLCTACPFGFLLSLQGIPQAFRHYSTLTNPYREDDFRRFIGLITQLPAIMKAIIVSPRFSFRVVPHTFCHTAVVSVLDSVQVATPYTSSPHIAHSHAVVVAPSADASTTDYPNTPERE